MSDDGARPVSIALSDGAVSGLLLRPRAARLLYVMAHGAGAGMRHPFMESVADALARRDIATLRYQFPYMEAGRRAPDRAPTLEATVRAAVAAAHTLAPGLPLLAGGKSMGGRMTSRVQSAEPLPDVCALAFLGFPLHRAGRPDDERAAHLAGITVPMLFLQGTRDALADPDLMRGVCAELGARATLHEVEGADHAFHVLRRSGRSERDVLEELADALAEWAERLDLRSPRASAP